jgi:hypothetical protein
MRRGGILGLLLVCLPALGGEAGYTSREIELKAEPAGGARALATLPKGTKVEILGEHKAWSRVTAGSASGWTLSFYVMKGEPPAEVGMGRRLSEVWSLGTERRAGTNPTLGIRGLDEEELKAAQFNAEELKRLEALSLPRPEGEVFAKQGGLVPQPVQYFAAPSQ